MPPSPYGIDRIQARFGPDSDQRCVYHVISRTALDGLPFKKLEKDERVRVIRRFSMVSAVDVLGFSIMDNHFYLPIEMSPGDMLVDDEVRRRFILLYNKEADFCEPGASAQAGERASMACTP